VASDPAEKAIQIATPARKRGRPPAPVPAALADEVCEWIAQGKPLTEWCRIPGKAGRTTVYDWAEKDKQFAERLARARDRGCDVIAEDTARLAESMPMTYMDAAGNTRIDPGAVQWHRLRVDTRLKLLACWNPAKYGTRAAVEHSGGVSISVVTGVPPDDSDRS